MRVAIASQQYPPETASGGIGTQTYLKAHGLAARGHQVWVLSWSPDGVRREYEDGDVRVIRFPAFEEWLPEQAEPLWWLTYSAALAAEIAALDRRVDLDLVDFPEWASEGLVHLLNATEERHLPATVHLHGPLVMLAHTIGWPDPASRLYRSGTAMERTCLELADAVYSSSRLSAAWCEKWYGLDAARIPVVHMGVDTNLFTPTAAAKAERPTILFVGRIAESKGLDTLIDAALELALDWPDLQVVLAGRGDDGLIARARERAARADRPDLFAFRGFVERERLPAELARGHLFAAPSLYEGGPGLVYLEAMACGLPVIGCEGSGVAEVVRHGASGLLVPPADPAALAAAVDSLLRRPEERERLGSCARQVALDEADTGRCAERLERVLLDALAGACRRDVG